MEIVTRQGAKASGLVRYFTGKPCARGHVAERYTRSTDCVVCNRENRTRKRRNNLERYQAKARETQRRRLAASAPERAIKRAARRAAKAAEREALRQARAERQKELQRRYRLANHDKCRELQRRWREDHKPELRAKKRARKKAKGIRVRASLFKAQRGRCAYCREKLTVQTMHVDHIHPVSKGGADKPSNYQLTCSGCNLAKSAKDPVDFARETGRLV